MQGRSARKILDCLKFLPNYPIVSAAVERVAEEYLRDTRPWLIGYSGGKDSTALIKVVFQAIRLVGDATKPIDVIYCDTGVEIPLAGRLAKRCLRGLAAEAAECGIPIACNVVEPRLSDRFFVKVIGRGYPPPTDKFRWCTDRLRINPVTRFLNENDLDSATVLLGVREAESATRKLTISENRTDRRYWQQQRGKNDRFLFMPILDFSVIDVWHTNLLVERPISLRGSEVADLYVSASEECPTVRDVKGAPCGKARFGCWTCTVAKGGVTLKNLIASGDKRLKPLLDFRLWLEQERNNPEFRHRKRRNGQAGPGPMTLQWRKRALRRLLSAEKRSGFKLLCAAELRAIQKEWMQDDIV